MTLHTHRLRRVSLLLLTASIVIGAASPAAAHEGNGILTVESQAPAGDRAVRYVVRLTWADDGHPALGSTVTATPIAPDGEPQTPVTLDAADEDGRYTTTFTFPTPGDWTVRFTSVTPTGSIEIAEVIASQPTSTTAPVTTTTAAGAGKDDPGSDDATNESSSPDDGGGSTIGGALALGVLVAVVVAAVVGFARSTRRRGAT